MRRMQGKNDHKIKDVGKWVVKAFYDVYSYELSSPFKIVKIRSHKKMTTTLKKLMDELYSCGIRPSKISRVLNYRGGGFDGGDFSLNDC